MLQSHRAAVAISVAAYNLTRIHSSLRVSPAMAAGLVQELWSVEDLGRAALAEPETARPMKQVLTLPAQTGPVRQLPDGKGWLRLVKGGPSPTPGPDAPVPTTPVELATTSTEPGPMPQPSEAPIRRKPVQLSLFDEPGDE